MLRKFVSSKSFWRCRSCGTVTHGVAAGVPDVPRFLWADDTPPARGFGLQHLPYGVFRSRTRRGGSTPRLCTRVGDFVLDLCFLGELGLLPDEVRADKLNPLLAAGSERWREVRDALQKLLREDSQNSLRSQSSVLEEALHRLDAIDLALPFSVGDFTDFYASPFHARVHQFPAWWQMPLGYHGRASSVVVSGSPIRRPFGQFLDDNGSPVFQPSRAVDFELEVGIVVGKGTMHGSRVELNEADDHVFGMVLLNDWSARDIQMLEMRPLGPFLGKSFATTVSPWVVPFEALAPFRIENPPQDPAPLEYLRHQSGVPTYDIPLTVDLHGGTEVDQEVCASNFRHVYWSVAQMIAHQTSNGCPVRPGDLLGTGTVSGPEDHARGCMAEWPRVNKRLGSRGFLQDGDTVVMRARCERDGVVVDFGECRGTVIPAE